jgi:hypothetical protein
MNSHDVDIRADIYSLGGTLYFLLTGRPPFDGGTTAQKLLWHQVKNPDPIRAARPEVPEELEEVVTRMMAKDPSHRHQEPAEVIEAMEPFVKAPPPPGDHEMPRLCPLVWKLCQAHATLGAPRTMHDTPVPSRILPVTPSRSLKSVQAERETKSGPKRRPETQTEIEVAVPRKRVGLGAILSVVGGLIVLGGAIVAAIGVQSGWFSDGVNKLPSSDKVKPLIRDAVVQADKTKPPPEKDGEKDKDATKGPKPIPVPPDAIPAEDASKHVGQEAKVVMIVRSAGRVPGICLLNSEEDFKDLRNFTVLISNDDLDKFKAAGIEDPTTFYKDKKIVVSGKIKLYEKRKRYEIQVKEPAQIALAE